ncbi:MAG TPA: GxxExxY protein [Prolixibacteraceae bacterium]|nr:GxxExxY protein [Prolixibacteraceae bacterium]
MKENDISFDIRGAAFKIHSVLGPGLLESVYEMALAYELEEMGYTVRRQVGIPMTYKNISFEAGFRLDLLVSEKVIVEIKSVANILDVHHKQLLTYLRLSDKKLGLLINFNTVHLKDSITRIVNKL